MPNTTNFNWSTPADTDLVKNGASAIRTLGNSIDTSFVDLKGGTTGQVLKKTSGTDLDFEWGSGASAFNLINTTTFTTASTTSIDSLFSSTYDNYQIRINFTSSVNNNLTLRFRTSGADASTAEYGYTLYQMTTNSTVAFTGVSGGATSMLLSPSDTTQYGSLIINVGNPFSSTINTTLSWQGVRNATTSPYLFNYSGSGMY
jgi:hypothetical protein